MYVWNGFSIVGKRKDLSENLLVTVEKAEEALQNQSKCVQGLSPLVSSPVSPWSTLICGHPQSKTGACACHRDKGRTASLVTPVSPGNVVLNNGHEPQKTVV